MTRNKGAKPPIKVKKEPTTKGGVKKPMFTPKIPSRRRKKSKSDKTNLLQVAKDKPKKTRKKKEFVRKERAPQRATFTANSHDKMRRKSGTTQILTSRGFGGRSGGSGGGGRSGGSSGRYGVKQEQQHAMEFDEDTGLPNELDNGYPDQYRPLKLPLVKGPLAGESQREGDAERMDVDAEEPGLESKQEPPSSSSSNSDWHPPHNSTATCFDFKKHEASGKTRFFMQLPSHLPITPEHARDLGGAPPGSPRLSPRGSPSPSSPSGRKSGSPRSPRGTEVLTDADRLLRAQKLRSASIAMLFSSNGEHGIKTVPQGQVGRMIVYKSGRVKLELGGSRMDISRGVGSRFHQELLSVDPQSKECHQLGDVSQRLVASLDAKHLLKQQSQPVPKGSSKRGAARGGGKGKPPVPKLPPVPPVFVLGDN